MEPISFALYSLETGLIENTILMQLSFNAEFVCPEGYGIVENSHSLGEWSHCGIGWSYINGEFIEPPNPIPQPKDTNQPIVDGAQTL